MFSVKDQEPRGMLRGFYFEVIEICLRKTLLQKQNKPPTRKLDPVPRPRKLGYPRALGGARADATRVRSGAGRAVVEGRFTTTELGDGVAAHVDEILDSSGAERDDDGSVIAARSVSRDGPSRAYLG